MVTDFTSLSLIALIAFLCPLICQIIPHKAIPETVLLLGAGALAGPHGLGLIQVTDAMALLSDLGLAFLFLLAGYEISPKSLTGPEGKRGAATWAVSFAIAFAVVLAWPALSPLEPDGMAVTIALTTTAMGTLLPILQERQLLKTRVGEEIVAFGTWGELFPILAMTLLLSSRAEWLTILILLAFGALAVLAAVLPKIAHQVGSRIYRFVIANANTNAQMTVRTVNVLLIGLVAISAVFDLDIVLGAFAAGFILRHLIPDGDPTLEMKHNAMAYGFFVPLFFVVSGAKIDMGAVTGNPEMLLFFVALLLFVRALPIFIALSLKRTDRLDGRERLTVAFYCTTALPIIVAVTAVAVSAGAMEQSTASVLVAAGGLSVLIMPLLASLTAHSVNAELGGALREIRERPRAAGRILAEHRRREREVHRMLKERVRNWDSFDLVERCPEDVPDEAAEDDGR